MHKRGLKIYHDYDFDYSLFFIFVQGFQGFDLFSKAKKSWRAVMTNTMKMEQNTLTCYKNRSLSLFAFSF